MIAAATTAALSLGGSLPATAATTRAPDLTSSQIVALFNAERTANGLPPVSENPEWSVDCALHDQWMAVNGIGHIEPPGSPAYTEGGAWAGAHAVLAGTSWRAGDPFRTAPIHLAQMMDPRLRSVGAAESGGYSCLTTWPGYEYDSVPAGTFSWFPGQNTEVAPSETASELPTLPQVWVGIPEGTTTGPHLYLYYSTGDQYGGAPAITSAALTGPGGPVEVRTVSDAVASAAGYAGYLPTAAVFIPRHPLAASSTYTLTVTTDRGNTSLTFRTTTDKPTSDGTSPSKARQKIRGAPTTLQTKHAASLPRHTTRGRTIKWRARTPHLCRVAGSRIVTKTRRGTCILRAQASGSSDVLALNATVRIRIVG